MKRSSSMRRCSFESLEDRRLMAGDVFARIVGGNLIVRGDDAANSIVVSRGPATDEIYVRGFDADGVATRVNGTPNGTTTFTGFNGRIDIQLKGGNDTLNQAYIICRGVSIDLGSGNDSYRSDYMTDYGDLCFNASAGDDQVTFYGTYVTGSMKVDVGGGNNSFVYESDSVGRRGEFKAGGGNDSFRWLNVTFDSISVDLGGGANTLGFDTCTVSRDAQFTAGNGTDSASIVNTNIDGKLGVCLGNGANFVNVGSSELRGDTVFRGGSGADQYVISSVHFAKSLLVDLGSGTNDFGFGDNRVDGKADFKGGDGADEFRFLSSTFAWLNVTLGKGDDRAIVSNIVTTRTAKFDGGDGKDSYLEETGTTSTFAGLVRKSFEIFGTISLPV